MHVPAELVFVVGAVRVEVGVRFEIHDLPLTVFDECEIDDAFQDES